MMISGRPDPSEAADYYSVYIDKVNTNDICTYLSDQSEQVSALLGSVSEARSLHRYESDKWSVRELIGHLNDTERVFAFRALWFGRGFVEPLPSFDQHISVGGARADLRTLDSHLQEFRAIRAATVALFRHLPVEGWTRRGTASGHVVSVRALAFLIGGHVAHHVEVLTTRYLSDV
jgi:DinB family protein